MALGAIVRLIDTARLQTSGCLEGTLRLEFFNALKEFLRRSDCWREDVDIPTLPGVSDYELPTWGTGSVTKLVWLEGKRPPTSPQNPNARGSPKNGMLLHPETLGPVLRLDYTPAVPELWYAHVALTCADPTDSDGLPQMPAWIAEAYHDQLTSGLLSRVLLHPNKPYSNKDLAGYHGRRFNEGMALAKKDALQGYRHGGQAWTFPQTFRTRTQRTW